MWNIFRLPQSRINTLNNESQASDSNRSEIGFRLQRSLQSFLIVSMVLVLRPLSLNAQPAEGVEIQSDSRPNILWISCEDISPHLGCYGFGDAVTPNLDRLAAQGVRFDRAFVPAGVCAVVRSSVITGTYAVAIGSQHMRTQISPRSDIRCFTEYLRAQGYFCTNRSKTDYQFASPITAWDRQGDRHRDWAERAEGQPFFSVINLTMTHESQVRHSEERHAAILEQLPIEARHDPDITSRSLPPYLMNRPNTRRDWAWYHDNISYMDQEVGKILERLEREGLADNTIVFFWSDHGQGLPRGKRWLYDSGTHIPLIVRWPAVVAPNTQSDELVSILDLPATVLKIAGVSRPSHFVGRVIVGPEKEEAPEYLFFHRDRMDEALDTTRGVRDVRYRYLRNFEPERPYAQGIDYMDLMGSMIDLRAAAAAGELDPVQKLWMSERKPIEEFYDLESDPNEIHNLIDDPVHLGHIAAMRTALESWQVIIGDKGMLPEAVQMARMKSQFDDRLTRNPSWSVDRRSGTARVELSCETQGASIGFRRSDDPAGAFRLYVQPFEAEPGIEYQAIACRIGWDDSELIKFTVQD